MAYPSLYAGNEDGKVTTSAAMWGLQGGDPAEQITMTRYYAAQRTFWVDPVSGTIVKETEHANHYFARDPLKPELTLADYKVTSNQDTVESQVNAARDERDRLSLWSRVLPITFTAVGLIALVGGGLLASFSLRTESALTDPGLDRGDQDFFGRSGLEEPVPGAEAETEKLPTQRPTSREDPGADAPTLGADEPPESRGRPSPPVHPNGNSPPRALDPARVRVGLGAAGGRAAAQARLPAAARRRVDAALVCVRYRAGVDVGASGDTARLRGGAGLAGD